MLAKDQIEEKSFTDILFEDRNKKYGAYELRMAYGRNVAIGLGLSIGLMVLALLLPFAVDFLRPENNLFETDKIVDVHVLPPPPGAIMLEYIRPIQIPPAENVVPVITKDSIQEKKKEPIKEKPQPKEDSDNIDTSGSNTTAGGGGGNGPADAGELFLIVDEKPVPPGGSWNDYVSKNLRYPEQEKAMNIQGKVYVSCIINKDGTLVDIKVVQGVSPGLNAEALRVVKNMPPWTPAKRHGQPVRMILKLPINFSLQR